MLSPPRPAYTPRSSPLARLEAKTRTGATPSRISSIPAPPRARTHSHSHSSESSVPLPVPPRAQTRSHSRPRSRPSDYGPFPTPLSAPLPASIPAPLPAPLPAPVPVPAPVPGANPKFTPKTPLSPQDHWLTASPSPRFSRANAHNVVMPVPSRRPRTAPSAVGPTATPDRESSHMHHTSRMELDNTEWTQRDTEVRGAEHVRRRGGRMSLRSTKSVGNLTSLLEEAEDACESEEEKITAEKDVMGAVLPVLKRGDAPVNLGDQGQGQGWRSRLQRFLRVIYLKNGGVRVGVTEG